MMETGEVPVPVAQNLIRLLYGEETPANGIPAPESVFEALRVRLSSVLGAGGYSTLLVRSISLTRSEHPWLDNITVDKSGALAETVHEVDPREVGRGFAALLHRFITLLTIFIGADLTNRLLETIWRDLETIKTNANRKSVNL